MMIFVTVFLVIRLGLCSEIDTELNKTVNLVEKNLHQGTPNILVTLGETIKDHLANPVSDAQRGKQIIEDLFNYYRNLRDVLDMLKSKDVIEKKLGEKLFSALLIAGGPPHMDEDFDMENAMEKYQWNNRAVFTVRKVLDETDTLWQDIQVEVAKPPPPDNEWI